MKKRVMCAVLCMAVSAMTAQMPGQSIASFTVYAAEEETQEQVKDGLVKENGVYHYYKEGKLVKSSWQTVEDITYYFRKNGDAAVVSCKIKGKYYVFDKYGKLVQPSAKKIVKVETADGIKKYQVNADGTAAGGWSADKKYYFSETGEMVTGIVVLKEKFYCFNAGGAYNAAKTKKLRTAAKYEKSFAPVKKIIGKPKKTAYYASCYGAGKDGILTYDGFVVYTFKPDRGAEIFMGVE